MELADDIDVERKEFTQRIDFAANLALDFFGGRRSGRLFRHVSIKL